MVYIYHSFLIHSSADGHLGCFHVLAMINTPLKWLFFKDKTFVKSDRDLRLTVFSQ